MNVTSKGRYALRIMIDLAQHREDGFISAQDRVRAHGAFDEVS